MSAAKHAPPPVTGGRRYGRTLAGVIVVLGILPVFTLFVLHALQIPLGLPGKFTYLYSDLVWMRQRSLPVAMILAAAAAGGVWLIAGRSAAAYAGGGLIAAAVIGLGLWAYFSPPAATSQHTFNFLSPSQDGAFLHESRDMGDLRRYLADFPHRARTPPAEMRGTRIISNPPGATLLALTAREALRGSDHLRALAYDAIAEDGLDRKSAERLAHALAFSWLLLALWVAAVPFLYLAGRELLPAESAAAVALCSFASAATLLLSPGKDPAQLLTIAIPLWLWFRALRTDSVVCASLAGILLVPASLLSLVHLWLAAILVTATLGPMLRARAALRRGASRLLLPAGLAFIGAAVALYFSMGMDLSATLRAAAASQAEVTRTAPDAMPLRWQLLGVPLFLLFCGPAVWCALLASWPGRTAEPSVSAEIAVASSERALRGPHMGAWLLVATTLVMLGTLGFTNAETPRLWIAFVPLLLIGAALRVPALQRPDVAARRLLALLVFVQILSAAVQWTFMDMREAEMRLIHRDPAAAPRLFN